MSYARHCDDYWSRAAGTPASRPGARTLLGAQVAAQSGRDDPAARKAVSERNRQRAHAHYSVDAMVASYARLYASLLGHAG
jgi:hypothetical protein